MENQGRRSWQFRGAAIAVGGILITCVIVWFREREDEQVEPAVSPVVAEPAAARQYLVETRQAESAAAERKAAMQWTPPSGHREGMVRIPAGEFPMGSEEGEPDERPVHRVALDAYWLDRFEVTVAEYRACVEAGACTPPDQGGACTWERPGRDAHPVNCVDWAQTARYCSWVGERLPTEAEWERAARGVQGRRYAWGDGPPQGRQGGNVADESARQAMPTWTVVYGYDDGYPATAPVGRFDPTPEGLYDMSGNLTEWVADWYEAEYYARGPRANPLGPGTGQFRVVRGGSWRNADDYLRASYRYGLVPGFQAVNVGFRCAR